MTALYNGIGDYNLLPDKKNFVSFSSNGSKRLVRLNVVQKKAAKAMINYGRSGHYYRTADMWYEILAPEFLESFKLQRTKTKKHPYQGRLGRTQYDIETTQSYVCIFLAGHST